MATGRPNVVAIAGSPASKDDLFVEKPTKEILSSTHTEELVIALCGPIGSPLHEVADKLHEMLEQPFGYVKCNVIRLSKFIGEFAARTSREVANSGAKRRHDLITLGNEV